MTNFKKTFGKLQWYLGTMSEGMAYHTVNYHTFLITAIGGIK
jgi:hypothetical protein